MNNALAARALSKLKFEDILWAKNENLISNEEIREYLSVALASYEAGDKFSDLLKLSPDSIHFQETLDGLISAFSPKSLDDPEVLFLYLLFRDVPGGKVDSTEELYRVMSIFSDVGAPEYLGWVVFLWPTNPYKDVERGDDILYSKILDYARAKLQ